jgi:hypothetical protein
VQLLDSKLGFYIDKLESRLAKELKEMRTELNVRLGEVDNKTTGFVNMAMEKMTELTRKVEATAAAAAHFAYVDDQVSAATALLIERVNKDKEEVTRKLYDLDRQHLSKEGLIGKRGCKYTTVVDYCAGELKELAKKAEGLQYLCEMNSENAKQISGKLHQSLDVEVPAKLGQLEGAQARALKEVSEVKTAAQEELANVQKMLGGLLEEQVKAKAAGEALVDSFARFSLKEEVNQYKEEQSQGRLVDHQAILQSATAHANDMTKKALKEMKRELEK